MVALAPGMAATMQVKTGTRRTIRYVAAVVRPEGKPEGDMNAWREAWD